jgi:methionine sulfoxide reductase heme-binding subunit
MSTIAQPPTRAPNPTLGTTGDQRRRLLFHHVPIALVSAGVFALWMTLPAFQAGPMARAGSEQMMMHGAGGHHGPTGSGGHHAPGGMGHHGGGHGMEAMGRATMATGYIALGLVAFTLLIGPGNLLLRRRNPLSNYLRRDAGAWAAIVSVAHVIIVFMLAYGDSGGVIASLRHFFVAPNGSLLTNNFGLANWTGLAATVIVVGLLAISSDFVLRKLKARPWKWLQRLNYALFALIIAHAVFFGALLRLTSSSTVVLGFSVISVFIGQILGIWLWRRRYARTPDA